MVRTVFYLNSRNTMLHRCLNSARSNSLSSQRSWNWSLHHQHTGVSSIKHFYQGRNAKFNIRPNGGISSYDGSSCDPAKIESPGGNLQLSDNQQLVHFLNGADLSNPPDWRIKPYTQMISSLLAGTSSSIRKIRRSQNQMADVLARQCLVLVTLQSVTINFVMVLTASCC